VISNNAGGDPEMVPGYNLMRRVGSARQVETYEARENTSGSTCNVKLFSPSVDSDLILREARVVKALFDPGLIGVYDADALDDGRVFIVTEHIEGRSLREVLANSGAPDLLAAVGMIRQTAEALNALHSSGIVHGAIEPRNIFVMPDTDGPMRLRIGNIDYGRALERSVTSNKFEIDSHTDALRYFAPEQCSGDERTPGTDVYRLGVVFYEMLAGAPPFDSQLAAELIDKHRNERPPEIRINNFELRMLVTHALSESLQKQPAFRQASANVFARQLRHIEQLATHTSTPPPAGVVPRAPMPARPRTVAKKVFAAPRVEDSLPEVTPSFVAPETERPVASRPGALIVAAEPDRGKTSAIDISIDHLPVLPEVEAVEAVPHRPAIASAGPDRDTITPKGLDLKSEAIAGDRAGHGEKKLESSGVENGLEDAARPVAPAASAVPEPDPQVAPMRRSRLKTLKRKLHELSAIVKQASSISIQSSVNAADHPIPIDAETPAKAPKKIAWVQPDDDIPSEEDVLKVLAKDGSIAPVVPDEIAERPSVIAPEEPAVAVLAAEAETIVPHPTESIPEPPVPDPVVPDVIAYLPRRSKRRKKIARPSKNEAPATPAAVKTVPLPDSDEEITLVRPPRRIRVDLERPRTIYGSGAASRRQIERTDFVPTILGERRKTVAAPAERTDIPEGMFTAYYGARVGGSPSRSRAITIGSGFIVLTGFFLFANDSASKFFQNLSPGDSVTAQATGKPSPSAAAPKTSGPIAAKPRTESVVERSVPDNPESTKTVQRPTVPDPKRPSTDKVRREDPRAPKPVAAAPKTVTVRKPAEVATPKPSPRRTENDRGSSSLTRPRVVADPRP
jgi:serine/threonine-protein kinase